MNKAYRVIWSRVRESLIVVAEIVTGRGGPSRVKVAAAVITTILLLSADVAYALPSGGQVAAGQVVISAPSTTQMNINQGTNQAIINWNSFGIGKGEAVKIAQPTSQSTLLNRVLGNNPSSIFGSLTANGQVFLVNPSGVLFAPGASVNVGGLVASSLNIKDNDFLAGKYSFFKDGAAGSVVNQGNISGGFVALLGNSVENAGTIVTTKGTTGLAAGDEITLGFDLNGLMAIKVDKAAYQAHVTNSGVIEADGGTVVMTASAADALLATVVNNSGTVRARSMVERNGEIVIEGGNVTNSGTLDVSGQGEGGVKGGTITLSGDHITLASGSLLDATGKTGGGTVLVGGEWQGSGAMHQATTVTMEQGAKIDVSATQSGNGGTAVLWSDVSNLNSVTNVNGEILAQGGVEGGDGGQVETSGHKLTIADSASVKTGGGSWLLDPTDFTIGSSGDITGAALTSALASNNITITTTPSCVITGGAACADYSQTSAGTTGDIIFNDAVSWSTKTLTLSAYRNIAVNNALSVSGSAGLTLTTNTGAATGVNIGYLKTKQANGSFGGKIDWTSNGALSMNGSTYTKIIDQAGLAAISTNYTGKYFLANDISMTAGWATLSGGTFTGVIDGLGHTLSNLSNGTSSYSEDWKGGLFYNMTGGTLQNLGIASGTIYGGSYVGGFAAYAGAASYLRNLFTASALTISPNGSAARERIGGILGTATDAYIVDTNNAANINSPVGAANVINRVGGLVGYGSGYIKASANSGTIIGGTVANKNNGASLGWRIGGIFGEGSFSNTVSSQADGISNSGAIYGHTYVGGIVGSMSGNGAYLTNTGNITGIDIVGGIAGNANSMSFNYIANQGNITGKLAVGGLFGGLWTNGASVPITINHSYNQGAILSTSWGQAGQYFPQVGGLVGAVSANNSTITVQYSYNTGSVTNNNSNGIGTNNDKTIVKIGGIFGVVTHGTANDNLYDADFFSNNVYSTGTITADASSKVGGFAGSIENSQTYGAYLPVNTYVLSGSVNGGDTLYGFATRVGGTGTVSAQNSAYIKTLANYTTDGDFSTLTGANSDYPIITNFAPVTPVTITFLQDRTKIYGAANPSLVAGTDYSLTGCSACLTVGLNTATLGQYADVGNYLYSTSNLFTLGGSTSGYSISYLGTTYKVTVNPATLTVTGTSIANKTYTGTNTATFSSQGSLSGALNSDAVSINAGATTATFNSVNVANSIGVSTSYALTGAKAGNYTVTNPAGLTANITQAPLRSLENIN